MPTASSPSIVPPPITIVGIGTSAGGLEALEQFFKGVPADSQFGYVVVQHLDPTQKSLLVELLQRSTPLPVASADDRVKVLPGHVYVIPPNRDLALLQGSLYLTERMVSQGLNLPIDLFFRSLAADQQDRAIGVILSGMGSDGTLGLRAIKEQAGLVFVQDPSSAKFEAMPCSVIDAGLADVVAPAELLAGKIGEFLQHSRSMSTPAETVRSQDDRSELEKVVLLLRTQVGNDFSHYKKSTIYRRIERRMGLHQLDKMADYARYLRENPGEAILLFQELLIGVTSFFRDPPMWEQLINEALPSLMAAHPDGTELRAWVPACSTGEEAYSLAVAFVEAAERVRTGARWTLQIFATDLDKNAIEKSRVGVYPANIAVDVSAERLARFFVEEEHGYRVCKEIRQMVIFAPQNVAMDPPFTRLDLLSCRNLLIYLEPELQKKLLDLFHYSLRSEGILVLGSSETAGQSGELFNSLQGKNRVYRRQEQAFRRHGVELPLGFGRRTPAPKAGVAAPPSDPPAALNLAEQTKILLLSAYTPAAVLATDKGDILFVSGKTGRFLEPAAGKANLNLFAMAREGLAGILHEAFAKAFRLKAVVTVKGVVVGTNGGRCNLDLHVQPLQEPSPMAGYLLVVFADATTMAPNVVKPLEEVAGVQGEHVASLLEELQYCRLEMQSNREDLNAAQEELKSAEEEHQSTNEELQSTNEELTTSKEEMQSMNEELQTVNQELQTKLNELARTSDDMKNLLNSTEIATLFLDGELRVRRFTVQATTVIHLIPGDTGRPVSDLTTVLDYPGLQDDAMQVLQSLIPCERQAHAHDGRWFHVRILPYRTQDNRIDGVVLTFNDITQTKALETTVREALAVLQSRFEEKIEALDRAQALEALALKTQEVLEKRLAGQAMELQRAHDFIGNKRARP